MGQSMDTSECHSSQPGTLVPFRAIAWVAVLQFGVLALVLFHETSLQEVASLAQFLSNWFLAYLFLSLLPLESARTRRSLVELCRKSKRVLAVTVLRWLCPPEKLAFLLMPVLVFLFSLVYQGCNPAALLLASLSHITNLFFMLAVGGLIAALRYRLLKQANMALVSAGMLLVFGWIVLGWEYNVMSQLPILSSVASCLICDHIYQGFCFSRMSVVFVLALMVFATAVLMLKSMMIRSQE